MRTHGTLTRWNDDRGFGFIQPSVGTQELFVHVSAFPRDGVRPRIGETISFEIVPRDDGGTQAVRVTRPGGRGAATPPRRMRARKGRESAFATIFGVLLLVPIGWYAYSNLLSGARWHDSSPGTGTAQAVRAKVPQSEPGFRCDGRTRCSQMTSCAEASYFLKQCPGTRMDGDGDGVACESQWCDDQKTGW